MEISFHILETGEVLSNCRFLGNYLKQKKIIWRSFFFNEVCKYFLDRDEIVLYDKDVTDFPKLYNRKNKEVRCDYKTVRASSKLDVNMHIVHKSCGTCAEIW